MSLPKVLCITGAPRTGTHLLNSIVCASPCVTPMLQEALPLIDALEAYRKSLHYRERYGESLGVSNEELADIYGQLLRGLVLRMAERFGKEIVVLRGPLLAKHLINLQRIGKAASLDVKIAFLVRWPADAIASMYSWDDRSQARGVKVAATVRRISEAVRTPLGAIAAKWSGSKAKEPSDQSGGRDPERLRATADTYMSYYNDLIRIADFDGIKVVRYEDIVTKPRRVAAKLGSFLDLDLSEGKAAWDNSLVDYTPDLGTFVTPLYGKDVSKGSIGRGDALFDQKDAETILSLCRYVVREFYRERDPLKTNDRPHPALV